MREPSEGITANAKPGLDHFDDVQQSFSGIIGAKEAKGRSVRGGAVTMLGQALSLVLQTGSIVVLARLLTPADYGLRGMIYTLTGFFSLFWGCGLERSHSPARDLDAPAGVQLFPLRRGCRPYHQCRRSGTSGLRESSRGRRRETSVGTSGKAGEPQVQLGRQTHRHMKDELWEILGDGRCPNS